MTSRGAEKMNNDTIGVDVSKDHLDAHRLADGAARRFGSRRGGGWNWVGVVSGLPNPNDSGVGALEVETTP